MLLSLFDRRGIIYTPQTRNVRDPLLIVACIRDLPCPLDNFKAECLVRTRQDVFDDKD
jgi:hypothetical protein